LSLQVPWFRRETGGSRRMDPMFVFSSAVVLRIQHSHASDRHRTPPLSSVRHKHFEGKLCH